jgi:hypothetical protein
MGAPVEGDRARSALFPLCRDRRNACAASHAEGMDREVQRPVRRGLGRLPRADAGTAEEARRRAARHEAHRALEGIARMGFPERRPEAPLCADDGSVRRIRRPLRSRTRARGGGVQAASGRRQYAHFLHCGRQWRERRRRVGRFALREHVLQRLRREVAGQYQGDRRSRRPGNTSTIFRPPGRMR